MAAKEWRAIVGWAAAAMALCCLLFVVVQQHDEARGGNVVLEQVMLTWTAAAALVLFGVRHTSVFCSDQASIFLQKSALLRELDQDSKILGQWEKHGDEVQGSACSFFRMFSLLTSPSSGTSHRASSRDVEKGGRTTEDDDVEVWRCSCELVRPGLSSLCRSEGEERAGHGWRADEPRAAEPRIEVP